MSAQIFQCLLYAIFFYYSFDSQRLLNFRIKDRLDQRKQSAVCKSRIVDCGKDKFITEIPEQEQDHQYDAYPVKDASSSASFFGRKEPAV